MKLARRAGLASPAGRALVFLASIFRPTNDDGPIAALRIALISVAATIFLFSAAVVIGIVAAMAGQPSAASAHCSFSGKGADQIPAKLIPIYESATTQYKLGERGVSILAAINKIETDFGRNMGPSSAGALGWMQFMPGTWAAYGVDANGDGRKDPADPEDAIHAAANYLHASGAPRDWHRAIFAYNHAEWYVADVFKLAENYEGVCEMVEEEVTLGDLDFNDTSGQWAGARKFAVAMIPLAKRYGCASTSEKRPRKFTSAGGVSDHWEGAKHSYAVDLDNCGTQYPGGPPDKTAAAVAKALGFAGRLGLQQKNAGKFRIQMIWQAAGHYDHVHVGFRRLGYAY